MINRSIQLPNPKINFATIALLLVLFFTYPKNSLSQTNVTPPQAFCQGSYSCHPCIDPNVPCIAVIYTYSCNNNSQVACTNPTCPDGQRLAEQNCNWNETPTPTSTLTSIPTLTQTPTLTPIPTPTLTTTISNLCSLKSKGDSNCDSTIDLIDFEILRRELFSENQISLTKQADFNGDGRVDLTDFKTWSGFFTTQNQ